MECAADSEPCRGVSYAHSLCFAEASFVLPAPSSFPFISSSLSFFFPPSLPSSLLFSSPSPLSPLPFAALPHKQGAELSEKYALNRKSHGVGSHSRLQGSEDPDYCHISWSHINQIHKPHRPSLAGRILTRFDVMGKSPFPKALLGVLAPAPQVKPQGKWGLAHLTWAVKGPPPTSLLYSTPPF